MLHKNVIENKWGFRELSVAEQEFVSGGDIIVTGNRDDDGWVSVSAEDMMYLYPELFGNDGLTGGGEFFGDGGGGDGFTETSLLKNTIDEFKDWLLQDSDITEEELKNSFVTIATIGTQTYVLIFDASSTGEIYSVDSGFFSSDFSYVGDIRVTSVNTGGDISLGVGSNGITVTGSDGTNITFEITGRGG